MPQVTLSGTLSSVRRTDIAVSESQLYVIHPYEWRVWNAMGTALPTTASADDLGFIAGTLGTNYPCLKSADQSANAALTSAYAAALFQLPPEYDAENSIRFSAKAGMQTVAAQTATLDVVVYRLAESTTVGTNEPDVGLDLVSTGATSINSNTWATYDFTLNSTGLYPGDLLQVRIDVAIEDNGAGGDNTTAFLTRLGFKLHVRG